MAKISPSKVADEIDPSKARRTYLITYSQADIDAFPTRESFAKVVKEAFTSSNGKSQPLHWSCAREKHTNGGVHYHMALKLSSPKRWLHCKNEIYNKHKIVIHFSEHENYYSAFRYISKYDTEIYLSSEHPNLQKIGSPNTKHCHKMYARRRSEASSSSKVSNTKSKRLSNLDVSDFIVQNKIKTQTQLLATANIQKEEGKRDLASFVFSRTSKSLDELISQTWKMQNAQITLERQTKCRMDIIQEVSLGSCAEGCNGSWLKYAEEVLANSKLHPVVFGTAVRELLTLGRGKYRNIIIVGPSNCGKTFLLKPLESIFKTFANPASDKYAWVGADNAEIIFLNDFRWSPELIEWKSLLLLLEGDQVRLPAPKNHFSCDINIERDTPVFATSKCEITFRGKYNLPDKLEDDMMKSRWRVFTFHSVIAPENQKSASPCGKCFSQLVLMGYIQ